MKAYQELVKTVLETGQWKGNRTGIDTKAISGYMLSHDLRNGFPLLTTKKMGIKNIATELEFFIKGLTDKQWLKDRGCHIWDDWCSPTKVLYGNDSETKKNMKAERDLGPIYGYNMRYWGKPYQPIPHLKNTFNKEVKIGKENVSGLVGKEFEHPICKKYTVIKEIITIAANGNKSEKFNIQFNLTGYVIKNLIKSIVISGEVTDRYYPTVLGIACLGEIPDINLHPYYPKLRKSWQQMLRRCYAKEDNDYVNYGERGVYVIDRWLNFHSYFNDIIKLEGWELKIKNWKQYSLDKDFKKGECYSPFNCIWADASLQAKYTRQGNITVATNKKSGKTVNFYSTTDMAEHFKVDVSTIRRYCRGERKHKEYDFKRHVKYENPIITDQLLHIVSTLKKDPSNRRLVCSYFNVENLDKMSLIPCHVLWHLVVINGTLNLNWFQRSCDVMLGVPYNLASYALLLKLLAKTSGLLPGVVTGMLSDVHIYKNHIEGAREQIKRDAKDLPEVMYVDDFTKDFDIFNFDATKVSVSGYTPHPGIKFDVAV